MDEVLLLDEKTIVDSRLERDVFIKTLRGRNINPWYIEGPFDYAFYPYKLQGDKTELINEDDLKHNYPNTYQYLLRHKTYLINRKDSRKTVSENKEWYGLIRKGKLGVFKSEKIVTPALTKHNSFAIDRGSAFLTGGAGVFVLIQNELSNMYLLAVLNSKLIEYFLHSISTKKQNSYYSYLHTFLSQIPVIKLDKLGQQPFVKRGEKIASNVNEIGSKLRKFRNRVLERFGVQLSPNKLSKFHRLKFTEFINTIYESSPVRLSLKETDEWEDYFNSYKLSISGLITENQKLNEELDKMVFDLYNVSENQRQIIVRSLGS